MLRLPRRPSPMYPVLALAENEACSLAPSGVGFKSLYYVPQDRVEASREDKLVRESSRCTIKNASQVLLGTQ